jgi:type I restriction-modification system DNA methylase subunit
LLFLKWFLDHLAEKGSAGIVVPEGVVMGTDKASVELRKMLVEENQLLAVVSLPHSSFKPYASVSTYVLVFRKGGKTDRVWMYRVEADGFSQDGVRQPVIENDIPDLLDQWRNRDGVGYAAAVGKHGWVTAQSILQSGVELAPRVYLSHRAVTHEYPVVPISELCTLDKGTSPAAKATSIGKYPLVTTAEELRRSNDYQFDSEAVCIPLVSSTGHGHASIKRLTYIHGKFSAATIIAVLRARDPKKLSIRYLYYFLESHKDDILVPLMKGAANVSLSLGKIGGVKVPLPPIDEQLSLIAHIVELENNAARLDEQLKALSEERIEAIEEFKNVFA